MNGPVRRVAIACLVLFGALMVNANYIQVFEAHKLRNNSRNARVLISSYDRERGPIVVGGQTVAESKPTTDSLKYLRTYPGGPAYAPVTGFFSLVYGATAIERADNDILSGTDDRLFVRRLSDLVTGRTAQGGSVVLTLNPKAQAAAFAGLQGKRGAVVAIDPSTGAILAMASSPSYDPSVLSSHDTAAITAGYKKLTGDTANPMLNRAIRQNYPPGSVFKVVTAAAALSSGRFKPDTQIPAPDKLKLPLTTNTLSNFGGESCGDGRTTSLTDALRISCNTAFAQLGLDVGADALRKQADAFGFSDNLSLPLQAERSVFPTSLDQPQTALSAIGQYEVKETPLQAALVAAGVANRGKVMRPYLVQKVQAPDLSVLSQAQPEVLHQAVDAGVADQLTAMMEAVVTAGTGTAAQVPGVRIAGKTGTAQHADGKAPHAWFIGFGPVGDAKVAVAVLVEDGGNAGSEATGGQVAAPIAKSVIQAVLGGGP
ncbi:MAG: penicillin-binding protein 2 [Actinomycetota bacterium]|nr:penicillin-binding protein 2 [Actinomycetota bacterium]